MRTVEHVMTVRVPVALLDLIRAQAKREDRSVASVVRVACRAYLSEKDKEGAA